MDPLARLLDIESRLDAGTIAIDEACAMLFSGPKPWHTAWWKLRRAERLASACNTCGSSEPPLVLQHTWQPIRWQDALRQAGPPHWLWWKEQHPLPDLNQPFEKLINTPVCPYCGSYRIRSRVRTKDWVCIVGQSGKLEERHAQFAFLEPRVEPRPDKKAIRRHKEGVRSKYELLSRTRWEAWLKSPEYDKNRLAALRLCIADSKRYLSLEDTKTLCRPCAGREDYHHIRRHEIAAAQWDAARPDWSAFEELENFVDPPSSEGT